MDITLKDFLNLYDFEQTSEVYDCVNTKIARIYYDQPICGTDDGRWFEFGVNDHYITPEKEDIIEKVISKDILNQMVKYATVVEYDTCNPILRIDTYVCNDSFEDNNVEDDTKINTKEETSKNSEEQNSKTDILSETNNELRSKVLTEKQIMFLKGLGDKWKYICCDGSICISTKEPIKTPDGSKLIFGSECDFEYIDNLTDNFLFCKNEIYLINDLIRGDCDAFLALGYMGDYVKRFPQEDDLQDEDLKF